MEHYPEEGQPPHRVLIRAWPFRIGRSDEANHTVHSLRVSSLHAEIVQVDDDYILHDLGSTNGTFLNGSKVEKPERLRVGDVILIAHKEMRFGIMDVRESRRERTLTTRDESQQRIFRETNDLLRILDRRGVRAVFQPIVKLSDYSRMGYETLGRPALPEMTYNVLDLFRIAVERGDGARLSRLMRERALEDSPLVPEAPVWLFFNLHPEEMVEPDRLEQTLVLIAESMLPNQHPVIEIHESAVTDAKSMSSLRDRMGELKIELAYDDFGAGQSRLSELIQVPPDYLKLDMSLVRDIDKNKKQRELTKALVQVIGGMGIAVLAEGVERIEEAQVCAELGCVLAQGYYFGKPQPIPGSEHAPPP